MEGKNLPTTSRLSFSDTELKALPFTEEGYLLLMEHIGDLSANSFPFVWKTGISKDHFNSVVQESLHFKGVFKASTGEVILYKASPTSSAHEIPSLIVAGAMCTFNLRFTNNDDCDYPICGIGGNSITDMHDNEYTVDGSWFVLYRTIHFPNVILEHSYTTNLRPTHAKVVEMMNNGYIKCAIIFDTFRKEDGTYSLLAYTIRRNVNNYNLYIPNVISYGDASPSPATIQFINALAPQNQYGIGLSADYIAPRKNLPQYQLVVQNEDLMADSRLDIANENNENIHCFVDLFKIKIRIMAVRNFNHC
jgi:hypothetical protein